jgi:glutamine amidotransferase
MTEQKVRAAIVDHGLGNLFSVQLACARAGMDAHLTTSPREVSEADVVLLPGVGAFGDAIDALHRLDLVEPLRDVARSGRVLVGICLGLQLLMRESREFGAHRGLGLVEGDVVPFENAVLELGEGEKRHPRRLKVPQIGWNTIERRAPAGSPPPRWEGTPLQGVPEGAHMYFVHSFYVRPENPGLTLTTSTYGGIPFCSGLRFENVFAFQFHPERSGPVGLRVYENIRTIVLTSAGKVLP